MNCSMPGLPAHHQLPEFTQTHVHWVGDGIQPSHPLSSPSPPAPNPSQHQSFPMSQLFAWGGQSTGVSALASFLPKKSQSLLKLMSFESVMPSNHLILCCPLLLLPSIFPASWSFPGGSDGKESACNAGDRGSIPGSERSPGEGNGYPLQYSCLEKSMNRSLVGGSPWGCTESDMTEWLHFHF